MNFQTKFKEFKIPIVVKVKDLTEVIKQLKNAIKSTLN